MAAPVVLWFRNDLRVADHAALHAAAETGQPVLPVFVLDDAAAERWAPGGASRWWLHHSLAALARDLRALGPTLVLRRGSAVRLILDIVQQSGATALFAGACHEPWARRQDAAVADALRRGQVAFHRLRTATLFQPQALRTRAGTPYGVYTPFARACQELGVPQAQYPVPQRLQAASTPPSDALDDWALRPNHPDWAGGLRASWTPGEADAQARLRDFLADALDGYAEGRDRPDVSGTSMLSPHLHFGEISPVQLWHAVQVLPASEDQARFLRELLWREFCYHLLWHHTDLPDQPLHAEFAAMPWRHDPAGLRAWQRGQTGVPIVDAGMRQLWQTGWMHNRVRMIVASFLVKHLLLPWQDGEAWFWDTLVDADLANNAANWQWVAGCGADAAPYFRIFNPVLQGRKFDPDGAYVRRFVPELARLEAPAIHVPWDVPPEVLARAKVRLGQDYPTPLVELGAGRKRALEALASMRNAPASAH
jgi:deoxyribodipyrimidine photo-lyase